MTAVIHGASQTAALVCIKGISPAASNPIQHYADAHNALQMALHYMRQPQVNVPGAVRKAVQALAALRRLDATERGGAA